MNIDVTIEAIRAFLLAAIFAYLLYSGNKSGIYSHKGWRSLVSGFAFIFIGSILDVTDNFPTLNRFVVIGDTPYQALLEKLVFSLGGFMLLYYGFREWLPYVTRYQDIEAEKRYRRIIEKSSDIVFTADTNGYFTYVNPAAEQLTGFTRDELTKMRFTDLVHPDYKDVVASFYENQFRKRTSETLYAFPMKTKKDTVKWVEQVVTPENRDNEIVGFQSIVRDITERKRVETALVQAKLEAEASSASKSAFLANMSHELRTPLNSVIGFSNLLLKNEARALTKSEITFLERINENGNHLLDIINTILDLSKVEAGKMELDLAPVNITKLIKDVVAETEAQMNNKPVELKTNYPSEDMWINSDEVKLKQILLNIVGNGIKFTDTGQVKISLEPYPKSKAPHKIYIEDTGIGIPEDKIENIFSSFKQADTSTSRKYGGIGLGLTISKQFATLLGFSLSVDSKIGKGSKFILEFPDEEVVNKPTREALHVQKNIVEHIKNTKGKKILVVDEDNDSVTLLAKVIAELGAETIVARNGAEALEKAIKEKPNMISLALELPDQPGWEILKSLKKNTKTKNIPVIIVSIIANEKKGSILGAVDYIQKPINKHALQGAIKRNIDRPTTSVLIVEDDQAALDQIAYSIKPFGVEIVESLDGTHAKDFIDQGGLPDIIILDLLLPQMNGISFFKQIRQSDKLKQVPVIIVTAKEIDEEEENYFKDEARTVVQKGPELIADLRNTFKPLIENGEFI